MVLWTRASVSDTGVAPKNKDNWRATISAQNRTGHVFWQFCFCKIMRRFRKEHSPENFSAHKLLWWNWKKVSVSCIDVTFLFYLPGADETKLTVPWPCLSWEQIIVINIVNGSSSSSPSHHQHPHHRLTIMIFLRSSQLVNFMLRGGKLRWWAKLHPTKASSSLKITSSSSLDHPTTSICIRLCICIRKCPCICVRLCIWIYGQAAWVVSNYWESYPANYPFPNSLSLSL